MNTAAIHIPGVGEQAGIVLFSRWDEFCRLRAAVLEHLDIDSIHDLRVASRRLRATLALFLPFLPNGSVRPISKEIRIVTRALGHVRNLDEAMVYVRGLTVHLPVMTEGLGRMRKDEVRAVVRALKKLPVRKMDGMIRKDVAGLTADQADNGFCQRFPAYLSETSVARYQTIYRLLPPAAIPENVEVRHRLRIAIKKWRYLLEAIGQMSGQEYGHILETLKEYQTILGNLNDMVEFGKLSKSTKLPSEEAHALEVALNIDAKRYFSRFAEVAATRPLHYTFYL